MLRIQRCCLLIFEQQWRKCFICKATVMKNIIYLILVLVSYFNSYAQSKVEYSNSIGISIPVIFNNSNGIYYSGGNRKEPTGKATSYGINCNFQRTVYKKIFLIAEQVTLDNLFTLSGLFILMETRAQIFYTRPKDIIMTIFIGS